MSTTAKVANLVRLAKKDMKRLIRLISSMSKRYQVRALIARSGGLLF
jgi:hypothetical protein